MPTFNQASIDKLTQCHPDLVALMTEVIKYYDCTIICGHRGQEEQEQAFRAGHSKVNFPNSKHNQIPSLAVDVVPYPIDWNDLKRLYHFVGFVTGVAKEKGIPIRCGADWDGDMDWKDQNFHDLPHFELITK